MSFDLDKRRNLAEGLLSPIIGLVVSTLLSALETISTDQSGACTSIISGIILLIKIRATFQDLDSIRVNGLFYGIGFVISLYLVNGL